MDSLGWRAEISEELRKNMITEMYHELLRISGESDRQKVWQSAAKFELTLWTQLTDKNAYLSKLQKKITALKKKPQPGESQGGTVPVPVQPVAPAPSIPQTQNMYHNTVNNAASMQYMMQAEMMKKQQEQQRIAAMNLARQQQAAAAQAAAAQAQAQAQAQQAAAAAAAAEKQKEQQRLNALNLQRQQAAQQALAGSVAPAIPTNSAQNPLNAQPSLLLQQFQQQKQALVTTQHNEMQRLRQQQLLQQNQLANAHSTQDTPLETRRLQIGQLQQQHQLAQNKLNQEHKAKQAELLRRQQQMLMQHKAKLATTPTNTVHQQVATPIAPQNHVSTAQSQAAQVAQQQSRAMSRQNSLDAVSAPQPVALKTEATLTYGEKLKQLKAKYWDDLELVNREFTRMAAQKPANNSQQALQQQERIKNFLQNLKRIMNLLAQDPSKGTSNNREVLDKVEQHIERQVMPTLQRIKADKAKTINDEAVKIEAKIATDQQQRQAAALQQAQALHLQQQQQQVILAQQRAAQEALKAKKAEQMKQENERMLAAQAALKAEQERKAKEEAREKELADMLKQQLAQRNTILTLAQRQTLQDDAEKIKQQQHELRNQQTRAKSPASQAKLAQHAHILHARLAKIAQQLANSKIAEVRAKNGNNFVSIVPTTGMTATENFLTAIATYSKEKPDILTKAAPVFMDISLALGATVTTSFE